MRLVLGEQNIRGNPRAIFAVLWIVFFFHGMGPGFWVSALTNILRARGLGAWVPTVFMVPPLCALVGPPQASSVMDLVLDVRISQSWPATVQQC